MKRIVVGIDGSDESRGAALFAADLAAALGARLSLVTVIPAEERPTGPDGLVQFRARWLEKERDRAEAFLQQVAAACERPGLRVETDVYEGAPAITLADAALSPEIEMVVVGDRGRNAMSHKVLGGAADTLLKSAVARLLLGSVADRLMQISPKPVLVYRGA